MLGWFGNNKKAYSVDVDIHSHLIPEIDDGARSIDESIAMLTSFQQLGYKKIITTPHIHSEYYPNTKQVIESGLQTLKEEISRVGLTIKIEAAAEYYIDSEFLSLIENSEEIMSFGRFKYVLMETPFMNKPLIFDEVVFQLKSHGFVPVLAHPERYTYLMDDMSWLKKIRIQGVQLQITSSSLVGGYGKGPQKIANQLLKENMVDFIGSDLHRKNQLPLFEKSLRHKIIPQNLKNNELI
ncbi:tyrosine-protein phosphatase [Marinoscillum pacificum]|uniref:tyrosine-protein phosphatase n=1 Tax=Marinoscillum pacificum TaxID=392723 RepID=UPI0021571E3E|nr:CpsB/CapC family capsule biosynthesis tyrosine phosphatase [Marinoscillum pacificum]